jgi:peptidoglycan/xylan/chitin deacetylase (PgdA/CDA1 family)
LAVLQQKHVLATFFEIGRLVETNPALTAALAAAGDVIGNHTYNHAYLTTLTPSAFDSELDRTSQVIAQVAGRAPRCLRPPYGATNSSVQARLTARGLAQQMWTVDPSDYKVPPVSQLVTAVVGSAAPGGVVILHDGGGDRSHTVAAVSQIIDGLRAAGFTLVPVCW